MRTISLIFYIFLALLGITFAILNASSVAINFYVVTFKLPVSIFALLFLVIGVVLGLLFFLKCYWRLKLDYYKLKNQLKLTEKEIKNLRSIPLQD